MQPHRSFDKKLLEECKIDFTLLCYPSRSIKQREEILRRIAKGKSRTEISNSFLVTPPLNCDGTEAVSNSTRNDWKILASQTFKLFSDLKKSGCSDPLTAVLDFVNRLATENKKAKSR